MSSVTSSAPARGYGSSRSAAPAAWRPPISLNAAREVGIVTLAVALYFFVRGLMDSRWVDARANALGLIDLERALGIFVEPEMQAWSARQEWLSSLANTVYIYGHWPVIAATLVWLLLRRRDRFPVYRTALLASGAIGLVFFVLLPMSPPRFLPEFGFVDTVTLQTNAYRVLQPPSLTNPYAAMPSLHVGWNLLMGIAIFRTTRHPAWRAFAIVMPLAMALATVLTANHFILDGVVGSIIALAGLAIGERISAPALPAGRRPTLLPQRREMRKAA
jgi:hypothetical protein